MEAVSPVSHTRTTKGLGSVKGREDGHIVTMAMILGILPLPHMHAQ